MGQLGSPGSFSVNAEISRPPPPPPPSSARNSASSQSPTAPVVSTPACRSSMRVAFAVAPGHEKGGNLRSPVEYADLSDMNARTGKRRRGTVLSSSSLLAMSPSISSASQQITQPKRSSQVNAGGSDSPAAYSQSDKNTYSSGIFLCHLVICLLRSEALL